MDSTYDALDRATIKTWRASNIGGWGLVALVTAILIHQVADQLTRTTRAGWLTRGTLDGRFYSEAYMTGWDALRRIAAPCLVAIVVGFVIGTIVGKKVWRHQVVAAAIVAMGYVLVAWLALETSFHFRGTMLDGHPVNVQFGTQYHGFPVGRQEWLYAAASLFAVAIAPLWAGFLARRAARRAGRSA